jgi:hypothetical protein
MSLLPTDCELLLFDVHTCLSPVDKPNLFAPGLEFLAWYDEYSERYWRPDFRVATEHFTIEPLTREEISESHFWRRITGSAAANSVPALLTWHCLPLLAQPGRLNLELTADDLGIRTEVKAVVYLWPWGWSTNLKARITGELPLASLREIIGGLRKDHARKPLSLDGSAVKPWVVFSRISGWIQEELYRDGPLENTAIHRHFFLAIQAAQGDVRPYSSKSGLALRPLDKDDRAALHGVLLGREVLSAELEKRETADPRPFLYTDRFTGAGFALTDREQGSVLVLPGISLFDGDGPGAEENAATKKRCLTENVKSCAMLAFGLAALLRDAALQDPPKRKLDLLVQAAAATLRKLGGRYRNELGRSYLNFPQVQNALQTLADGRPAPSP